MTPATKTKLELVHSSGEITMQNLPDPLTPQSADLTDWPTMPLDVARMRDSKFSATVDPEAGFFAFQLWAASWHRIPAASLPDDDRQLCQLAGLGRDLATWERIKGGAMYGFLKCSDGKFYHPVIAEKSLECWIEKVSQRIKSGRGNASRWGCAFSEEGALLAEFHDAWGKLSAINGKSKVILKGNPYENHKSKDIYPTGIPSRNEHGIHVQSQGKEREGKVSKEEEHTVRNHPETSEQQQEEKPATPEGFAVCVESSFDEIWESMPLRKVGKQEASKAWGKLCKRKTVEQVHRGRDVIMQDLQERAEYVQGWESPFWSLHLATYLNNQRWKDEDLPERRKKIQDQGAAK